MSQLTFRLMPGQDLKTEIERVAKEKEIRAGVLLSIVGGLADVVLRMAGSMPEQPILRKWAGPFEIVAGTGTISNEGCHIHVALSDREGDVIGGHLKDGCIVHLTAEIVIGIFEDTTYRRMFDKQTGFKELVARTE